MSALDTIADRARAASDRLAGSGGLKGKLAQELADDADFLRKLKPSLMAKRARGEAPRDEHPGRARLAPSGPQLGKRPSPNSGPSPPSGSTGGAMPTHAGERRGLGAAAKLVSERASSLVRLELQLAAAELKQKVVALGLGIALLVGAAVLGLFALLFALATAAAALATTLSTWLALLVVTAGLVLLAGVLGALGLGRVRKGTPPIPVQAIEEAKLTTEALKNGRH